MKVDIQEGQKMLHGYCLGKRISVEEKLRCYSSVQFVGVSQKIVREVNLMKNVQIVL